MMATDRQSAYSKGYAAGVRNQAKRVRSVADKARQMIRRAERAEAREGMGLCAGCCHWQRWNTALWGYCQPTDECVEVENWPWRGEPEQRIITKENFGCIRFDT